MSFREPRQSTEELDHCSRFSNRDAPALLVAGQAASEDASSWSPAWLPGQRSAWHQPVPHCSGPVLRSTQRLNFKERFLELIGLRGTNCVWPKIAMALQQLLDALVQAKQITLVLHSLPKQCWPGIADAFVRESRRRPACPWTLVGTPKLLKGAYTSAPQTTDQISGQLKGSSGHIASSSPVSSLMSHPVSRMWLREP